MQFPQIHTRITAIIPFDPFCASLCASQTATCLILAARKTDGRIWPPRLTHQMHDEQDDAGEAPASHTKNERHFAAMRNGRELRWPPSAGQSPILPIGFLWVFLFVSPQPLASSAQLCFSCTLRFWIAGLLGCTLFLIHPSIPCVCATSSQLVAEFYVCMGEERERVECVEKE